MIPGLVGALISARSVGASVRGGIQSSSQTAGGTFAPTLPTHYSGDVLVVLVAYRDTAAVTASGGWSQAVQTQTGSGGAAVFYRTATGSSHTITITNSNNEHAGAHIYAIENASGSVEATAALSSNPPSEAASWGPDANLWIAAHFETNNNTQFPNAAPTDFTDIVQTIVGTNKLGITSAVKSDLTGTLNPSAFTYAPTEGEQAPIAVTIAVMP